MMHAIAVAFGACLGVVLFFIAAALIANMRRRTVIATVLIAGFGFFALRILGTI
jgi:hypothetical protein